MEAAISDSLGGGGRLGLIELFLPHIQLMTLCCLCRWEWLCFPGYCLGIPVKMHQLFTDFHFFYSGKHSVACIFRSMGSITTLSQQTLITQAEFFNFVLILFLLLKFATHSILFTDPPSIVTRLHYRSCCASYVIVTRWNDDFLNLL